METYPGEPETGVSRKGNEVPCGESQTWATGQSEDLGTDWGKFLCALFFILLLFWVLRKLDLYQKFPRQKSLSKSYLTKFSLFVGPYLNIRLGVYSYYLLFLL